MICKNCKELIPDDSMFCPSCGQKVKDETTAASAPPFHSTFRRAGDLSRQESYVDLPEKNTIPTTDRNKSKPTIISSFKHAGDIQSGSNCFPGKEKPVRNTVSPTPQNRVKVYCDKCGKLIPAHQLHCSCYSVTIDATKQNKLPSPPVPAIDLPKRRKTSKPWIVVGASILLTLSIVIGILYIPGLSQVKNDTAIEETESTTEDIGVKYNTAYPDDILMARSNAITVEDAEAALRKDYNHDALINGILSYDNCTFEYPDLDSVLATFWFDITVPMEYGNLNYRAKVVYDLWETGIEYSAPSEWHYKDRDLWEVTPDFTQTGVWYYEDDDTRVWINYIKRDDLGYLVEYEIKYCAHYWIGSENIDYKTETTKTEYGDMEWDGDYHYLSIDLDAYVDGESVDLGRIIVYPWSGVFWDALHAYGGPYRLEKIE